MIEDHELVALLRQAIVSGASGLPRHADTFLATVCAEHLVTRLRWAGLIVCKAAADRPCGDSD